MSWSKSLGSKSFNFLWTISSKSWWLQVRPTSTTLHKFYLCISTCLLETPPSSAPWLFQSHHVLPLSLFFLLSSLLQRIADLSISHTNAESKSNFILATSYSFAITFNDWLGSAIPSLPLPFVLYVLISPDPVKLSISVWRSPLRLCLGASGLFERWPQEDQWEYREGGQQVTTLGSWCSLPWVPSLRLSWTHPE